MFRCERCNRLLFIRQSPSCVVGKCGRCKQEYKITSQTPITICAHSGRE